MKLQLTFTAQEAEDNEHLADLLKVYDYKFALSDLDNWLRDAIKYQNLEHFQVVRDELYKICMTRGISIE